MSGSESPHNLFPCWLSALLPFRVAFPPLRRCIRLLLQERLPHLPPVLPPVQALPLAAPTPHTAAAEGWTPGLRRRSSPSHQHLRANYLSHWTVTFPGMKPVIRRRRSGLVSRVTLQLTAFLACTIFRPQTTPFFCVWKACSSCRALGTNQPLYRELQKLLSPQRTAVLVHLG